MSDSSDHRALPDVVLVHQLAEAMGLREQDTSDPERARAVAALRHIRNLVVHGYPDEALTLEAQQAVSDVMHFLTQLEGSSLGSVNTRQARRSTSPEVINEILVRSASTTTGRSGTVRSDQYQRQLQHKREQQANAEKKASEARQKEADKRADATKARAGAAKSKSESNIRSRLHEAERHEGAANKAAKDAAYWQRKAAGYSKDVAGLGQQLAKVERSEAAATERDRRRAAQTAERRAASERAQVDRRLSANEAKVSALREVRPPKPERLRVLMLAASSGGDLRVAREQSRIRKAVESALHRDLVELDARASATTDDLLDGLTKFRPHVVHFSGHGDDQLVVFEDDIDRHHEGVIVSAGAFANALAALDDPPLLVLLNSCHSAAQIDGLVARVVPFAIGMSDEIGDIDAIVYATRFYASVADGSSLREAHALGRAAIELAGLADHELPRLAHAPDVDPGEAVLVVPPST